MVIWRGCKIADSRLSALQMAFQPARFFRCLKTIRVAYGSERHRAWLLNKLANSSPSQSWLRLKANRSPPLSRMAMARCGLAQKALVYFNCATVFSVELQHYRWKACFRTCIAVWWTRQAESGLALGMISSFR